MITSVVLGAITLSTSYLNKPIPNNVAKLDIPGRLGSVFQDMGEQSQEVEIRGVLKGTSKDTDKATLEGYRRQKVTYTDSEESFTMIVTYVDIPTVGGQPNHYTFTIKGYKYDQ